MMSIQKSQSHPLVTLTTTGWEKGPCRYCHHLKTSHRATESIPFSCYDELGVSPANRNRESEKDEPSSQDQAQLHLSECTSYLHIEQ